MSKSLRIAAVVGAVCSLGLVVASCTIASVTAPTNMVVGETATFRVTGDSEIARANNEYCRYSFAPDGIVSVGPRVEQRRDRDITAIAPGTTTMTVDCGMNKVSSTITVWKPVASFAVTPTADVADGLSAPLTATLTHTDGTTADVTASAIWSTANTSIAVMGGYGAGPSEVTGQSPGDTTYTATVRRWPGGPQYSASGTVTVGPAVLSGITISPITNLNAGETDTFEANGAWSDGTVTDVSAATTWTTSDPAVVAVDTFSGANGRVLGVDGGQATITGTLSGKQASILVTVTGELQSISMSPTASLLRPSVPVDLTVTASYSGPSGPYDRVVTPWPTFTPSLLLEIVRTGDAVAVRTFAPIGGTVEASLAGTTATSCLID